MVFAPSRICTRKAEYEFTPFMVHLNVGCEALTIDPSEPGVIATGRVRFFVESRWRTVAIEKRLLLQPVSPVRVLQQIEMCFLPSLMKLRVGWAMVLPGNLHGCPWLQVSFFPAGFQFSPRPA